MRNPVTFTVTEDDAVVTATACGLVAWPTAVLTTLPVLMSCWVTALAPVQVTDAPGANDPAGQLNPTALLSVIWVS